MATRKKAESFPDVCCGACDYARVTEDKKTICYAMPPTEWKDDDYEVHVNRGVETQDRHPPCVYFKHREHA